MPELPEVETIARNLRQGTAGCFTLPGRTITGSKLFWIKTLAAPNPDKVLKLLTGQLVDTIERRGKFLLMKLSRHTLIFHLRMSGDLLTLKSTDANTLKHIRFMLELSDGVQLLFNDPRKFGRVWVTEDAAEVLGTLGPEPLDEHFTEDEFHTRLSGRSRAIKPLLLDQTFLAGLGNIYTDEALHLSRIHPLTPSNSLDRTAAGILLRSIRSVLQEGIERNGASIDWVYRGGEYQNHFRVYGRKGEPCPVCGSIIQRIVVGQRGTHICPICQPNHPITGR